MKVSDFKNKKILTEFGSWKGSLYDTDELDNKLNSSGLVGVDNNTRKELEEISANHLTEDDVEFILEILNSLCKGSVMQQALANVVTYTTLRLVDETDGEGPVDPLGYYCFGSEMYEVNYIGLLLRKIVDEVIDISMNNDETGTRRTLYEFLTGCSLKKKLENAHGQLPDRIRNVEPRTLRKWVIAKVLIHEMAHAFLDRKDKSYRLTLEESMANLITLSVADHFGDSCFLEFVKWFIGGQKANYSFALNLYEETVKRGLPPCGILVCADTWAREMSKVKNSLKVVADPDIIYDANNQGRRKLADEVIDELVKKSGWIELDNNKLQHMLAVALNEKDQKFKIQLLILLICKGNGFDLKSDEGYNLSVILYAKNKQGSQLGKITTLTSNYIGFLNSGMDWYEWKKSWNSYNSQIYTYLPKTEAELDDQINIWASTIGIGINDNI